MRVSVLRPDELSAAHIALWRRFQDEDPLLASPYLSPEFSQLVAAFRPAVRVAVLHEGERPMGFFPFQRRAERVGKPVGIPLSDCQAVVAAKGYSWDAAALVSACGLDRFDFSDLLAAQQPFAPFHRATATSHAIDLSRGYVAYVAERRTAGTWAFKKTAGSARRLAREVGPLRFVLHDPDPAALRTLIDWKSRQYRVTRAPDVFAYDWTVRLLERIHATQDRSFAGLLSTLYVGDELAAAHIGMRSATQLHYWFPAHSHKFAKYSPGLILLTRMIEEVGGLGIRTIELGRGDYDYKRRFANHAIPVAQGSVITPSSYALIHRMRVCTEDLSRRLPLGPVSRWPEKLFRRLDLYASLR